MHSTYRCIKVPGYPRCVLHRAWLRLIIICHCAGSVQMLYVIRAHVHFSLNNTSVACSWQCSHIVECLLIAHVLIMGFTHLQTWSRTGPFQPSVHSASCRLAQILFPLLSRCFHLLSFVYLHMCFFVLFFVKILKSFGTPTQLPHAAYPSVPR